MKKALFLDRDGIINVDHGYVYKSDDFGFIDGIFDLLHLFKKQGYLFFILTNQSGIGRGYYRQEDFDLLTTWMLKEFKKQGIRIETVQHCPHSPEALCSCRKPQIGMVNNILKHYALDLSQSWMIGDKQSDIDLAQNAGIASSIAIGGREIKGAKLSFSSIAACKRYLEENKAIIKS